MTDREINVSIAELCGWQFVPSGDSPTEFGWKAFSESWLNPDGETAEIPDYTNDLNAMHEAEKTFDGDDMDTRSLWYDTLAVCCEWPKVDNAADLGFEVSYRQARATARQRAEAFLRVKGKWKE